MESKWKASEICALWCGPLAELVEHLTGNNGSRYLVELAKFNKHLPCWTGTQGVSSEILNMSVTELDLSCRATNCLEYARIITMRDLLDKTEIDLLKIRSFGKTSLREVKRKLGEMGLCLKLREG